MAGLLDPTQLGASASEPASTRRGKLEEPDHSSTNWYFTRDEIEKYSPSRKDGVDLKRETYFVKSYCTFLQDLGMRLKLPQVTIATAIVFCHRFFHYQSHARNDRYTIATSCMFLAGKVEETPTPLKDVIITSYEIRNKKDPKAVQKIRQKEVYEQQKELTLFGERVLLATLGFDLNVHHPYTPLVSAIKKFKVAQNALAQVAWNFVNDGLRTLLCLQFKPHHIAAGAIFLAAKFLKVKLPSEGEVVWWQEFDVTPLQLEEISNQMLELYEQNKVILPARGSEIGGSSGVNNQNVGNSQSRTEAATTIGQSQVLNQGFSYLQSAGPVAINTSVSNGAHAGYLSGSHSQQNETSGPTNIEDTYETDEKVHYSQPSRSTANLSDGNASSTSMGNEKEEILVSGMAIEERKADKMDDEMRLKLIGEDIKGKRPYIGLDEVNKDKVKAALEKRRKSRGEGVNPQPTKSKFDIVDEDDLIERELESGVEAAAKVEKAKRERKEKVKLLYREEQESLDTLKDQEENDRRRKRKKSDLDNFLEKRPISCIQDIVEKDQGRETADFPSDCTEEGELLNMQDQMHSPRFIDDQLSLSKQHENRQSPVKRHDVGTQDQLGQRDGSHDNKYLHGNHHYYHSSQSQLHRGDTERERNHYKDREKQEWDYKKNRHDHAK